jgi:hypothetical protein
LVTVSLSKNGGTEDAEAVEMFIGAGAGTLIS